MVTKSSLTLKAINGKGMKVSPKKQQCKLGNVGILDLSVLGKLVEMINDKSIPPSQMIKVYFICFSKTHFIRTK